MVNKTTKKWLSFNQQLDLLKGRNLIIPPAYSSTNKLAESFLSVISYYRLTSYRFLLLQPNNREDYKNGTTFNSLLNEYYKDIHYKQILFALIDIIEIAFKTQLIYCLAKIDICFHKDICNTESNTLNQKLNSLHTSDNKQKKYEIALNKVKKINAELNNSENSYINYKVKQFKESNNSKNKGYDKQMNNYIKNLPSWIAVEALSLGNLINIYQYASKNAKYKNASEDIAKYFNVVDAQGNAQPDLLLELLADIKRIRNIVAHFDKILTRESFQVSASWGFITNVFTNYKEKSTTNINKKTFIAYYLVLKYFADIVIPDNEFNALVNDDKNDYVKYLLSLKNDFITLSKKYFPNIKN